MSAPRLTGVPPARVFVETVLGFLLNFKITVGWLRFFVGHRWFGYLSFGPDMCRFGVWGFQAAFGRRWDAREGEIMWRHWGSVMVWPVLSFQWAWLDYCSPLEYPSALWTGRRDYLIMGVFLFGRQIWRRPCR